MAECYATLMQSDGSQIIYYPSGQKTLLLYKLTQDYLTFLYGYKAAGPGPLMGKTAFLEKFWLNAGKTIPQKPQVEPDPLITNTAQESLN